MHPSVLAIAAAAALALPSAAQLTLVAPNGYAAVEGNANNPYPWDRGSQSMRIQFVYDSAHFTGQGIVVPVRFTRLRYRPDAWQTSWSGGSWPNVRIDMATCPTDHLAASSTFAANLGPYVTTVHQGTVTVQPGSSSVAGPQPWHIDIALATPFVYDPAAGDLVLDIQLDGSGWSGTAPLADHVSSTAAPAPLSTRVFSTAGATAATGTVGPSYAPVCEFSFVPANGLLAAFAATPPAGVSPLAVQFTDQSYSTAPGGVVAWAWDFDGDGITDSTAPNPTHVYTTCGDFTVSLTVADGVHAPQTRTIGALVRTDVVDASFSATALGGGSWQLTDTTSPPALAWAWDFDGDGAIDSTQQHPVVAYGNDCSGTVRLTATRHCRTSISTRSVLQAPGAHSANLTGGAGTLSAPTVGNLFDVQVLPAEGVLVCGLTTATYTGTGPYSVSVYVTPGSYVGKDTDASQWRLVGTGHGVMNGGTPSTPSLNAIPLAQPFYLPAGSYGVAVWHTSVSGWSYVAYTNATAGPYGNPDLVVHPSPASAPGLARTAVFGGQLLAPRQWNGTFHYTKVSLNQQGGYGVFGLGCAGALGVPGNVVRRHPHLGGTMQVDLTNLPLDVVMYWWGFSNTTSAFGPLPVDLTALGAPGCAARVSLDAAIVLSGANHTASFQLALPNVPAILGTRFYSQGLSLDPGANALGLVASDAAGFVVGQ
jgi:PKD repeat protein